MDRRIALLFAVLAAVAWLALHGAQRVASEEVQNNGLLRGPSLDRTEEESSSARLAPVTPGLTGSRSKGSAEASDSLEATVEPVALESAGVAAATSVEPETPSARASAARVPRLPGVVRTLARIDEALPRSLEWLVEQQRPDGGWDGAVAHREPDPNWPDNPDLDPESVSQVRVTSFAVIALLLHAKDVGGPRHQESLQRAIDRCVAWQDQETGRIGGRVGAQGDLDHALATYALCEAAARLDDWNEDRAAALATALDHLDAVRPAETDDRHEAWEACTADLRRLLDPETRSAVRRATPDTLRWRYRLYHGFGAELGAHDAFAKFTAIGQRHARQASLARWMDDVMRDDLALEPDGSVRSAASHHALLGDRGVTALFCIVLGIVADELRS